MQSPIGPATESFTTGQVAKLLRVSPRTVGKWMDKGMLTGHRIPGSDHRRFMRADLAAFVAEHKLPVTLPDGVPPSPPVGGQS